MEHPPRFLEPLPLDHSKGTCPSTLVPLAARRVRYLYKGEHEGAYMTKISDDKTIYRDGKPVTDRPRNEIVDIHFNHVTPKHPDYNPGGATAGAASVVARIVFAELESDREKKIEAGRNRGEQKRKEAAQKLMTIQDAEQKLRSQGITKNLNKRIAKETGLKTDYVKKSRRADRVKNRGDS